MPIEPKKLHTPSEIKPTAAPSVSSDATTDIGRRRMEDVVMASASASREEETKKLSKEKSELEALEKNLANQIKQLNNIVNKL